MPNTTTKTFYLENFTSWLNVPYYVTATTINNTGEVLLENYTKTWLGRGNMWSGNLYIEGNLNVTGCIKYNGGVLGVCV
jgi:hypothetical protein